MAPGWVETTSRPAAARAMASWNAAIGTGGGATHVVGIGDVATHDHDAQRSKRCGVCRRTSQSTDSVAALDQMLADVGTGEASSARDEDGLTHAVVCRGVSV